MNKVILILCTTILLSGCSSMMSEEICIDHSGLVFQDQGNGTYTLEEGQIKFSADACKVEHTQDEIKAMVEAEKASR